MIENENKDLKLYINTKIDKYFKHEIIPFLISLAVTLGITVYIIYTSPTKTKLFLNLIQDKNYIVSIIIIIVISVYSYRLDNTDYNLRYKKATFFGLLAFILATVSRLQLVSTPFWIVWVLRYYIPY